MSWLKSGIAAAVMLLVATACGGESDNPEGAVQPGPEATGLVSGDLAGIPLPPAAEPLTAPSEEAEGSVVTQSFELTGSTPRQVLDDFSQSLPDAGWEPSRGPERTGSTDWMAEWIREGQVLRITSSPLQAHEGDARVSQFDLVLRAGT